jgi:hypothetical protein
VLAQHDVEQAVAVDVAEAHAAHHVVAALPARALVGEQLREPGISLNLPLPSLRNSALKCPSR